MSDEMRVALLAVALAGGRADFDEAAAIVEEVAGGEVTDPVELARAVATEARRQAWGTLADA